MQIIVHVNGFNEWVPVPADVDTQTAEFKRGIANGLVKSTMNGGYSMRVPKDLDTHVMVNALEDDIIQCVIQEMTRGDRQHLTRVQAVTRLLARHILPQQCHETHVEEFEVAHDDGPDEVMFRSMLGEHIACGNLSPLDLEPLLAAYMTPVTMDDHHDHLHNHFRLKPQKLEAFRAKRVTREETARAALAHFHASAHAEHESRRAPTQKKEST